MKKKPLILLTNDDGFYSKGIETLHKALKSLGQVYIVAPDQERSATSLALTLHAPLRIKKVKPTIYAVNGTPADCIYLALQKLLPRKPDLIISGLNHGPNLGQQDISYSGTVAGAVQGTFLGIPSMAVSCKAGANRKFYFDLSAKITRILAERLLKTLLPSGITLNINIPPPPIKGVKFAKLGQKRYNPEIIVKTDPRNRTYYWIGTGTPKALGDEDSDVMVHENGFLTITPLHTDKTEHALIQKKELKSLFSTLEMEISQLA